MSARHKKLSEFGTPADPLTDAEREVYEAIENGEYGPRGYARETDRSPGTVGNLLRRARAKKGGSSDE